MIKIDFTIASKIKQENTRFFYEPLFEWNKIELSSLMSFKPRKGIKSYINKKIKND